MDTDTETKLVAALWQVVAEHGWEGVTLGRLAAATGLSRAAIRERAPEGPEALLRLHGEVMDRLVQDGTVPGQGGTPRDRIFDAVMRRIDAMQPHRAGLVPFLRALPRHPMLAVTLGPSLPRSMVRLLEVAEVSTGGLGGALRVQGLTLVWLATLRAWLDDASTDLGKTMAALDRALDRAEQAARSIRLDPGDLGQIADVT